MLDSSPVNRIADKNSGFRLYDGFSYRFSRLNPSENVALMKLIKPSAGSTNSTESHSPPNSGNVYFVIILYPAAQKVFSKWPAQHGYFLCLSNLHCIPAGSLPGQSEHQQVRNNWRKSPEHREPQSPNHPCRLNVPSWEN